MTSRNEKLLLRIGQLNYVWTNTESLLIYFLVHLMGVTKEAAVVTFLTLNTTRARLDLVERLAKISTTGREDHDAVLEVSTRMKAAARLRNKFNHCIYSFDESGELQSTQLMQIADFGAHLKYGKVEQLDDAEIARMEATIGDIVGINRSAWALIGKWKISP